MKFIVYDFRLFISDYRQAEEMVLNGINIVCL